MRGITRSFGAVLAMLAMETALSFGRAGAAEPSVGLEGATHVITFTSPGVYDVSANDSSSAGTIDNVTLIDQDQKGNIDGVIVDKGTSITLQTNLTGTIRRSGDVTVLKVKENGSGDLGNGDTMISKGTKRSVITETPGGPIVHSDIKIKTCSFFRLPFSKKITKVCGSNATSHDGVFGHSGDWTVRVDLEQSPSGELFGFGKIITNVHSAQFKRETDVIISGLAKDQGLAKMKLSPLFEGGDGPVTIVAQINGASDTTSHPAILFVISVKGKLLGQKFSEVFHEEL
jgi:hypothetical protein